MATEPSRLEDSFQQMVVVCAFTDLHGGILFAHALRAMELYDTRENPHLGEAATEVVIPNKISHEIRVVCPTRTLSDRSSSSSVFWQDATPLHWYW